MGGPVTITPDAKPGKVTITPDAAPSAGQVSAGAPQTPGFLPSVAAFVEGKSPWYQDADPLTAQIKQSVAPANLAKNLYTGAKDTIGGAVAMGKDLLSNPNWFQTMPAGQRPSTMQKFVTEPAKAQWAKGQQTSGLESAGHYAAAALPLAGPWAANLGEQAGKGDIGGAVAQAAGGYLGTKIIQKGVDAVPDVTKLAMDFHRRAKTLTDIDRGAALVYNKNVREPLLAVQQRLKNDGIAALQPALEAEKTTGARLMIPAEAVADVATAKEATGYHPTGREEALLNQIAADPMDKMAQSLGYADSTDAAAKMGSATWNQLKNAPVTKGTAPVEGLSLDDAIKLRSEIGGAWKKAQRAGNSKGAHVLSTAYQSLGDAMSGHVEKLTGSTKPFDNYNKNMRASYELNDGFTGDVTDPIMDNHEAAGKLKIFRDADLSQVVDNYLKPKGIDPQPLLDAQKQARSLLSARDAVSGKMQKGAYRLIMYGGLPAATAIGVYGLAHGAGMYGMVPMAIASYLGSKMSGMPEKVEAGRLLKKLNVPVNEKYLQLRTQAPPPEEAAPVAQSKPAQIAAVQKAKGPIPTTAPYPSKMFGTKKP